MTLPIESVPFELSDPSEPGRVVRGVFDQPGGTRESGEHRRAVLVLHGFKGFFRWGFFPELARRIAEAGFVAVRFNFSGSGVGPDLESFTEDEAFEANSPSREREDALRVVRAIGGDEYPWIAPAPIGLFGHSVGGAIALLLAGGASPADVGALVTWGATATFDRFDDDQKAELRRRGWLPIPNARTGQIHRLGRAWLADVDAGDPALDPVAACRAVRAPTLMLHGGADESVPVAEAEALRDALPDAVGRLEILLGAGHTFGATHPLRGVADDLALALDRTLEHLDRHL